MKNCDKCGDNQNNTESCGWCEEKTCPGHYIDICNASDEYLKEVGLIRKEKYDKVCAEVERLQVQLAGCSVAALGGTRKQLAKPGMYGWSAAYEDVLKLRLKYERLWKALSY